MKTVNRILCAVLVPILLFCSVGTVAAEAAVMVEGTYKRYEILSPADLLVGMVSSVGTAEADFLNRYYDGDWIYNTALLGEWITFSDDGTPSAAVGVTEAEDGLTVTWRPKTSVSLNETEKIASVEYVGSVTLTADQVNRLLNYAWREAAEAAEAQEEIKAYEEALAAYEAYPALWTQYQRDDAAHKAYVEAMNAYNEAYQAYWENQQEWTEYEQKDAAYQDYKAARDQYTIDRTNYDDALAAYNNALDQYTEDCRVYRIEQNKIQKAITPIESMFFSYGDWNNPITSEKAKVGSLYQALQNEDLVSMMLKYQDVLCAGTNLTKAEFQSLKATSDELNALLRQYAEKREISDREAFVFYQVHYAEIRDKFRFLYQTMTEILKPSIYSVMCAAVDSEYGAQATYKKWRIKNVLCQIYLISCCMDDRVTADSTWRFFADDGTERIYYYSEFLNQNQIITDTNQADMTSLSWCEKPTEPTLVHPGEPPTAPTPVVHQPNPPLEKLSEPDEPPYVDDPTEPTPVDDPSTTRPDSDRYALVSQCADLLAAVEDGSLDFRTEIETTDSLTVDLTPSVTLSRRYDYDEAGIRQACESIYHADGTLAAACEDVAEEWEDAGKTYRLLGFKRSADGLFLYPIYESADKVFTVRFLLHASDEEAFFEQNCTYGQMPSPPVPTKEMTDTHTYEFLSWEPSLSPVRDNTTYVASFDERDRPYTVTFRVGENEETQRCLWGEMPDPPTSKAQYTEGRILYRWIGWDSDVVPVSGDAVYTACYRPYLLVSTPSDASESESNALLTQTSKGYSVSGTGNEFQIEHLLSLCQSQTKSLLFRFSDFGISAELSQSAVASLAEKRVSDIVLLTQTNSSGHQSYGLAFFGADGTRVFPEGTVRLSLPAVSDGQGTLFLRRYASDGSFEDFDDTVPTDGIFLADCDGDATFGVVCKYALSVQADGNGSISSADSLLEAGSPVSLKIVPKVGYYLEALIWTNALSGEQTLVEDPNSFRMPNHDGFFTAVFAEQLYRIEFRYHGGSDVQFYRFGETVTPPTLSLSFSENGTYYTFIGWSSAPEMVTKDAVYEAVYKTVPEEELNRSDEEKNAWRGVLRYWILPAAGIFAVSAAVVSAGIAVAVKLKKKRQGNAKRKK